MCRYFYLYHTAVYAGSCVMCHVSWVCPFGVCTSSHVSCSIRLFIYDWMFNVELPTELVRSYDIHVRTYVCISFYLFADADEKQKTQTLQNNLITYQDGIGFSLLFFFPDTDGLERRADF